jgi:hypothetical protein
MQAVAMDVDHESSSELEACEEPDTEDEDGCDEEKSEGESESDSEQALAEPESSSSSMSSSSSSSSSSGSKRSFYRPNAAIATLLGDAAGVVISSALLLQRDPALAAFAKPLKVLEGFQKKVEMREGILRLAATGLIIPAVETAATAAVILPLHIVAGKHLTMAESLSRVSTHVAAAQDGGPTAATVKSTLLAGCVCFSSGFSQWKDYSADADHLFQELQVQVGAPLVMRTVRAEQRKMIGDLALAGKHISDLPCDDLALICRDFVLNISQERSGDWRATVLDSLGAKEEDLLPLPRRRRRASCARASAWAARRAPTCSSVWMAESSQESG